MSINRTGLNILAALLIAALLAALAALVHFQSLHDGMHGPTTLAADAEHGIAVARQGRIDLLTADGHWQTGLDHERLGISAMQSDLAWLPDGRLLVSYGADDAPAICTPATASCTPLTPGFVPEGPVKFIVDDDATWLVDSNRHRVLRIVHGTTQADVAIATGLLYPNAGWRDDTGLVLTDTQNRRLLHYPVDADGQPGAPAVLAVDFTPAEGNSRPIAWVRTSGHDWMLVANSRVQDARLLQLAADGTATALPLPEGDPTTLRVHRDTLLVADPVGFHLWQVQDDGTIEPFGDDRWQALLAEERTQVADARRGSSLAQLALLLLLVAAVGIAVLEKRLQETAERQENLARNVDGSPVRWLDGPRPPATLDAVVIVAVMLSLPVLLLLLPLALLQQGPALIVGVLLAPWPLAYCIVWLQSRRLAREPGRVQALGISHDTLVVRTHGGEEHRYPLAQLPWSRRALHLHDRLLPLREQGSWLYPPEQLRQHLWPRLARRSRMGLG